jgi:hypothetical protein
MLRRDFKVPTATAPVSGLVEVMRQWSGKLRIGSRGDTRDTREGADDEGIASALNNTQNRSLLAHAATTGDVVLASGASASSLPGGGVSLFQSAAYGSTSRADERDGGDVERGAGTSALRRYMQLYAVHREAGRKYRKRRDDTVTDMEATKRRFRLRTWLDCVQFGCGLGFFLVYPLIWLALLFVRTTGVAPNLSWGVVWAPIMAAIVHPLVMAAIGAVTERWAVNADARSAWRDQELGEKYNLVHYAQQVKTYHNGNRCCRSSRPVMGCCTYSWLLLAPILLVLKLDGVISASWPVVFIPLWMLLPLTCCLPWMGIFPFADDGDGRRIMCGMLSVRLLVPRDSGFADARRGRTAFALKPAADACHICGSHRHDSAADCDHPTGSSFVCPCLQVLVIFFAGTLGTVCALLAGKDMRLLYALIPFWIFDGLLFCGACFAWVMGCCASSASDRKWFRVIGAVTTFVLVLALSGEIPAAIWWDQEDYQAVARALIAPALTLAVILSVAGCVGAGLLLVKARRKAFQQLYRSNWRNSDASVAASMPGGHAAAEVLRVIRANIDSAPGAL